MFDVPILFLIYNRPDYTEVVFSKIREIQPKSLFIAADGPKTKIDDIECQKTRKIVEKIDWPCKVNTLFRDSNLGCKLAVSSAIDWFFSHNKEGIILEDDTLPNDSFFYFCENLLYKYQTDNSIMSITGVSWVNGKLVHPYSYYFSNYPGIWGWATWANRWDKFDLKMKEFPEFLKRNMMDEICFSKKEKEIILNYLTDTYENKIDTWDYIWHFTHFSGKKFCIVPKMNLVTNIGFDSRSTHTKASNSNRAHSPTYEINEELNHPEKIQRNTRADSYVVNRMLLGKSSFNEIMLNKFKKWVRKLF